MNSQMPGLEDTSAVPTTNFQQAQLVLSRAVAHHDIAVLSGAPGAGKTYALEHFLASAAMDGRPHTWLDMPPRPAPKEVLVRTLKAVAGTVNSRLSAYELTDELTERLRGSDHVLIVDEAHNLKPTGLQQLRSLWQSGQYSWSLLLAGSELARTISGAKELKSRVDGLVLFTPLEGVELLTSLRAWHPLLDASSNRQLRAVDEQWARGNFRSWAKFLRTALELAPRLGVDQLTDELIAMVKTALGADAWSAANRS